MTADEREALFVNVRVPDEWRRLAREQGWPDDVVQGAVDLRMSAAEAENMLQWGLTLDGLREALEWQERLTRGPMRFRQATQRDNDNFAELWANSPEDVGEWEITVERGPNAFAQYRLQENVVLTVLADRQLIIASVGWSLRNVIVGGQRLHVSYGQALRVRKEFRRERYGHWVRTLPWPVGPTRPNASQYDYIRSHNQAVVNWWRKYNPDIFEHVPEREGDVPGMPVTVQQVPARQLTDDVAGVRKASRDDVDASVALINRTHEGTDLFRPYTAEFLENRLDEGFWGARPAQWQPVYNWDDYYVFEEGGRIVACAGLWDRGRDMRERWRHKGTGEERIVSATALMDFGFAEGCEDAMARLVEHLAAVTHRLGRDDLLAPLQCLPEVASRVEHLQPVAETRALQWRMAEPKVTRPYTDLAYW